MGAQYGMSFVNEYGEALGIKSERNSNKKEKDKKPNPLAIKIINAIRSIPTNEDLRKTYFWESRQLGNETADKIVLTKRISRLKKIWRAKWHSMITLIAHDNDMDERNHSTFP